MGIAKRKDLIAMQMNWPILFGERNIIPIQCRFMLMEIEFIHKENSHA